MNGKEKILTTLEGSPERWFTTKELCSETGLSRFYLLDQTSLLSLRKKILCEYEGRGYRFHHKGDRT